jgi:hypothetical protein
MPVSTVDIDNWAILAQGFTQAGDLLPLLVQRSFELYEHVRSPTTRLIGRPDRGSLIRFKRFVLSTVP